MMHVWIRQAPDVDAQETFAKYFMLFRTTLIKI